jgi:hypothetical protein
MRVNVPEAKAIIEKALGRGETVLSEYDSKRLLSLFGIPVNPLQVMWKRLRKRPRDSVFPWF